MLSTLAAGVVSIILVFFLWLLEFKRRYRSIAHVPGPKGNFLFGNALDMGRNPVEVLENTRGFMQKYGKCVQIWIGPNRPGLWISDVKFLEYILRSTRHLDKSVSYSLLQNWLGKGILLSGGTLLQSRRKLITPTFHFKVLSYFIEVFNNTSDILIEKLSTVMDKDSIDIYPLITLYTLDVICETAMGTSINAQNNEQSEYVQSAKNICNVFIERSFSIWKRFNILFWFSNSYKVQTQSLKILHDFTDNIIATRRSELEREEAETRKEIEKSANQSEKKPESEEFDVLGMKSRLAFLDLLMRCSSEGKKLSDADIRDEVDTIMFAGHDTTASAICFTIYEIARHPDVQEKLVDELRILFKDDKSRPVEFKDINSNLKYMEQVIKETLRLYPTVPFFARELKEDANYEGLILPKGLTLTMYPFVVHRDPELFPEPEKFIPERFEQESMKNKNPYAFIPFSAGPRNCIGQKYAMLEMKMTLTKILRTFELQPVPDHKLKLSVAVVLKSVTGICVQLKKRDNF